MAITQSKMILLKQLFNSDEVSIQGDVNTPIHGLSCDSRHIEKNSLFAAFAGSAVHGITFAAAAVEQGAVAVLTDETIEVDLPERVIIIRAKEPRQVFAHAVAQFFPKQPGHIVAVTGTNGKTSIAHFYRQLWHLAGKKSASIGTTGIHMGNEKYPYDRSQFLTTPDPVKLHRIIEEITEQGVSYLGMEASSHGLDQYRLDGVQLQAAGFSNLTQDHLDYHGTLENYFQAKKRLFDELLPSDGTAVINADDPYGQRLIESCQAQGKKVMSFGYQGKDITLQQIQMQGLAMAVDCSIHGQSYHFTVPLVGEFQVANLLLTFGLAMVSGMTAEQCVTLAPQLKPVSGRMEQVGDQPVFVDYAHTPDALAKALETLRPYAKELWVVFGCGGDRDKDKRPKMGKIANEVADHVIITDDNPRSEAPETIRAMIKEACPKALDIGDRKEAIAYALQHAKPDDVVLIAGKGHENYQLIGEEIHPFDDVEIAATMMEKKS